MGGLEYQSGRGNRLTGRFPPFGERLCALDCPFFSLGPSNRMEYSMIRQRVDPDEVVEFALVLFQFRWDTGAVVGIVDRYVGLRQPSIPIHSASFHTIRSGHTYLKELLGSLSLSGARLRPAQNGLLDPSESWREAERSNSWQPNEKCLVAIHRAFSVAGVLQGCQGEGAGKWR